MIAANTRQPSGRTSRRAFAPQGRLRGWRSATRAWVAAGAPAVLVLVIAATGPGLPRVQAQVVPRPTGPALVPPVPFSDPGDALAVEVSPATLAFERAWNLRVLHVEPPSEVDGAARADAVLGSVALPFGLALGAGVTSLRPQGNRPDRGRGSLALAWGAEGAFALGAALRFIRSGDPEIGDLTSLDLSTAWRPAPLFALTFDVSDVTGPAGLTELPGGRELPAGFRLAFGFRPFGTDALVLDLSGRVDSAGGVGARAAVDIRLPRLGRLRAAAEADELDGPDPRVAILAGLAVDWGAARAEGGAIVGDVRATSATGWYASALLTGEDRGGLPTPPKLVELPLRGDLDPHRLPGILAYLDRLGADPGALAGVLLRLRGTGMGVAIGSELGEGIADLRRRGVPVVCQLEAPSGPEWLACLRGSAIVLDPAGGIQVTGPATTVIVLGEALQRLGVRADFLRIGRFKSAPEQFENRRPSAPALAARRRYVDDVRAALVDDLAAALDASPERAAEVIDEGPYTAREAVAAGLVTGLADDRELSGPLTEVLGTGFRRVQAGPLDGDDRWSRPTRIGVVVVDGQIVDGRNVDIPILDVHLTGGDTVVEVLEGFARDPAIAAIVLRVDSPGGSALASDRIWRAVRRARRRKPVVASLGAVAASGGYYIASAADRVLADPATLTGSIGIFFGKVDVAGLAGRLGVHTTQIQGGDRAGYQSLFRPFTAPERRMLAEKVRGFYRLFLERVATGRGLDVAAVDRLGRGRIWSGVEARDQGLVDELGGFGAALRLARARAGLAGRREVGIVVRPERPRTLVDFLLGDALPGAQGSAGVEPPDGGELGTPGGAAAALLRTLDPALAPVVERAIGLAHQRGGAGAPLALLPDVIAEVP